MKLSWTGIKHDRSIQINLYYPSLKIPEFGQEAILYTEVFLAVKRVGSSAQCLFDHAPERTGRDFLPAVMCKRISDMQLATLR